MEATFSAKGQQMKELKAVEILKKYQDEIQTAIPSDIDIDEALAELSELTQEKSCEGCVYEKEKGKRFNLACSKCIRGYSQDHYTPKG